MSSAAVVRLEVEDGIGVIRIDRPPMNALDADVQRGIIAAAEEASERKDVFAVIVYGGEKVFAAGVDIKQMADWSYTDMVDHSNLFQDFTRALARIPKPTVAAITGYALGGGCEVTLACDFRIAASNAKLGQPEVLLGVIPGAGGTQRLARLIGPAKAKDLIFTGRFVDADEALAIGLVDAVVDPGERGSESVLAAAKQMMSRYAGGPSLRDPRGEGGHRLGSRGRPAERARDRAAALLVGLRDEGPRRGHALVPRQRSGQGDLRGRLTPSDIGEVGRPR